MKVSKEKIRNFIITIMMLFVFMGVFPNNTYASFEKYETYFVQVVIDTNKFLFESNVIKEPEKYKANLIESEINPKADLKLTFPASFDRNASPDDMTDAHKVKSTLIPLMNNMILKMTEDQPITSIEEFNIVTGIAIDGKSSSNTKWDGWSSENNNNVITLSKNKSAVGKYQASVDTKSNGKITMADLNAQAVKNKLAGFTASNALDQQKQSTLASKIAEVFGETMDGIRNALGMYTIDELVYNKGTREGNSFYRGVMPIAWMQNATNFHLVFQAIAWIVLIFAIIKSLFQINLGTINPMMRMRFYDGIRDLFMTGFLLAAALLIVNTLMLFNQKIVEIFATTIPTTDGDFSGILSGPDSKLLSSMLISFFYLIIGIYLNFIYIIRAISTAMLIASAPLFLVSISFEGKNVLFGTWLREIIANIFMQTFHAFLFSLFLSMQFNARGIESMVIAFAVIPLTEFFRKLILRDSGGMMNAVGMGAITAGAGALGAVGGGLIGSRRNSGGKGSKSNDEVEGNENTVGGYKYNPTTADGNRNRESHSNKAPDPKTTREALMNRERDSELETNEFNTVSTKTGKDHSGSASSFIKGTGKTIAGTGMAATGFGLSMVSGGKVGRKAMESGSGMMSDGTSSAVSGAFGIGNSVSDWSKSKGQKGNILGAETLPNGDNVIHRDKDMLNKSGLLSIHSGGGFSTHKYDLDKFDDQSEDRKNLMTMERLSKENPSILSQAGIESVSRDANNHMVVKYNEVGRRNMGYNDIYQAGNRIVEQKSYDQPIASKLTFNPNQATIKKEPDPRKTPASEIAMNG